MTYSVDWAARIITIPKTDTVFVSSPPEVRSLDVTTLWQNLIDIQDDEAGVPHPDIVRNTPPLTVAGVTLARVLEVVNGYTITFEDGLWSVNIVGGNSNLADVVNKNQVGMNTGNSAGFVQGAGADPADVADAVWAKLTADSVPGGSYGALFGLVNSRVLQLREGNIRRRFYMATDVNSTRNVAVGRLDYIEIQHRNEGDADWSSPASALTLYAWYDNLGDTNPKWVGEEG